MIIHTTKLFKCHIIVFFMNKKAQTGLMIGIIIAVVAIAGAIIYVSSSNSGVTGNVINENQQKEIICNSPYIKFGSECCLDQNSNRICDKDEQQREQKSYATINNFEGSLKWVELMDITASSSGEVPESCPNGKNEGDIWLEFSLQNLEYDPSYHCDTDLIEGQNTYLWSRESNNGWSVNLDNGYSIDGKVAFGQYLKEQHTVRVCCYPLEERNREICKSFILDPYC